MENAGEEEAFHVVNVLTGLSATGLHHDGGGGGLFMLNQLGIF